jgi:uncharacterized protein YciI
MSVLLPLILLLTFSPRVQQQQKSDMQSKLVKFHLVLLKKGPKWTPTATKETEQMHQAHVDHVLSLLGNGKAVVAGPLSDDGEIRGIYIFRTESADEATKWVNSDPAVASGNLIAEIHPWLSEDVFKKAATPLKLTTVYLAFLLRGEKFTPEQTAATEELQKAHLANIVRLNNMNKLIVAGPFGDEGTMRGIFVFRVSSMEEARLLTETDPAIKAGRLALELHPWQVPEGILP